MLAFARPSVRKANFSLFYAVHLVAAPLFFILLLLHGVYYAKLETIKYVAGPMIIYAIDRLIRRKRVSTHVVEMVSKRIAFCGGNVLQLSVPKPFDFRPGQYAGKFLSLPSNHLHVHMRLLVIPRAGNHS